MAQNVLFKRPVPKSEQCGASRRATHSANSLAELADSSCIWTPLMFIRKNVWRIAAFGRNSTFSLQP